MVTTKAIPTVSTPYKFPERNYVYDAVMLKVEDGDTVHVKLDLGCDMRLEPMKIRMNGINAKGKTTPRGKVAKAFLEELFPVGSKVRIETFQDKREKYGRYLGVLHHPDFKCSVNEHMLAAGLVEPYYGVGKASDKE